MTDKNICSYFSKKEQDIKPEKTKQSEQQLFPLQKLISGGQTGADRGGLEAAEALGIETGGTAPHAFWTIDGKCPELKTRFKLKELSIDRSLSVMYIERSKLNVDDSDATIAFRLHESVGTDKTIGYCISKTWKVVKDLKAHAKHYRPLLVIDDLSDEKKGENISQIQTFIFKYDVKVLNICGHREYKVTGNKSFTLSVRNLLVNALLPQMNHLLLNIDV